MNPFDKDVPARLAVSWAIMWLPPIEEIISFPSRIFAAADAFAQVAPRGHVILRRRSVVCIIDLIELHCFAHESRTCTLDGEKRADTILTPYGIVRPFSLRSHRIVYNIFCASSTCRIDFVRFLGEEKMKSTGIFQLTPTRLHQWYRNAN